MSNDKKWIGMVATLEEKIASADEILRFLFGRLDEHICEVNKKDAALEACIEAMECMLRYGVDKNMRAAITQAQEALK